VRSENATDAEFVVAEVIGEGGMGRVFRGQQTSLRREVAVKVLRGDVLDAGAAAALISEGRVMGALEHPNIVPVHALGRDERGAPALVMKRVDGVAFSELLDDPKHPAWSRIAGGADEPFHAKLEVLMQACNAVHFANSRGVVHRDLKPENVLIGEFGEVYVADWGIATEPANAKGSTHRLVGTPAYMAPEMLTGLEGDVDARTDVYLLGAMLHQLVTGRLLHDAPTVQEALSKAYESAPHSYDDSVPAELAAICARATERDPADRFPNAIAIRNAIADYIRHRGSISITEQANAKLDELRTAIKRLVGEDEMMLRQVAELQTECRFGFSQALREWPGNGAARLGLANCLSVMADHAIARGNADAARALLAEMAAPPEGLVARLESLDTELRSRRDKLARFDSMEREMDLGVSAQHRAALFAFAAAALLIIGAIFVRMKSHTHNETSHRGLVGAAGGLLIVVLATVAIGRKRLLATRANRGVVGTFVIMSSAIFAHRAIEAALDRPTSGVLTLDLLVVAAVTCVGAISVTSRLGWIALVFAVGAAIGTWSPTAGTMLFLPCCVVSLGVMIGVRSAR
jgi:serine/threonine-protein kinase